MYKKKKILNIINYFQKSNPNPKSELNFKNEYELAVAVVLSAQCTDKRVNQITPKLFEKYHDFNSLSKANTDSLFELIKSCSYPNNKTKHLLGLSNNVVEKHNGKLPKEIDELIQLPGVGRKTAHVLLSVLDNKAVLAVDTHVFRLAHRIGLVNDKAKTPLAVENQIVEKLEDKSVIANLHHWLILHGRYVCIARNPKCFECGITEYCNYYKKNN